ncbi:CHASE2 domain-containing protein [Arcobacter sp. LA11]|uniref:CHASE2 domain-containing protein n=1 Tax=Arcobacter sp. LA11 TaxID=1898176 RepID=UPI0009347866|nr:adenylate/guanylate cyclase domain-containing protein [Arcobacter sp. LA11]
MKDTKAKQKFFIYFILALTISTFLSFFYISFPGIPNSFDNKLRDYLFLIRGEIPTTENVIIVDIDEVSLKELGQWPWSRNKISKIVKNLTDSGVLLVGFDIVFPEEDSSSPHRVFDYYNIKKENIPNYDLEFAQTIASTPTILGYQFELEKDSEFINKTFPEIPAIFIEKDKEEDSQYLLEAKGTILNLPLLQKSSYSSGFFNNVPDDSGVVRSVPLIISYDDIIYSSLSLEMLRVLSNTNQVYIQYNKYGVEKIVLKDLEIPTDRHGRILVNYRGKERSFKYYSAVDIYKNKIDKKELENKIVLIGTSAAGLLDLRSTPFESIYPGVEVHANVIDNVIKGDYIYKTPLIEGINIVMIFVLTILVTLILTYTPFWLNPFIVIFFLTGTSFIIYKILFTVGIVLNIFFPILAIFVASVLTILFDYFYEIKKKEAIKDKFASKVSKEVMNDLLKDLDNSKFQAIEKEVTVFFSDIRNFTNISEQMDSAKNLITYLNQYMEPMSNIIIKYEGTIDKYIGDSIMAYWNAPANVENHADKALNASIKQINKLKGLNKKLKNENKPLIDIGIGLNTGTAIVGEMGSIGRSDYTVIGDSINLGARLESLCKYYDSKINISNFTKDALKDEYIFRFLDLVKVKGKSEPAEIWQVHGKGKAQKKLKEELSKYHQAIDLYKNSKFEEALNIFKELEEYKEKTNQNIYKIYCERCEEFISSPPENFNGIYEHHTKN